MNDDDLIQLNLEFTLGLRAQAMGRDQNAVIKKIRAGVQQCFTVDGIDVDITGDVPDALRALGTSWAIMADHTLATGLTYAQAVDQGALVFAEAGAGPIEIPARRERPSAAADGVIRKLMDIQPPMAPDV